jgi:hypothetical protein
MPAWRGVEKELSDLCSLQSSANFKPGPRRKASKLMRVRIVKKNVYRSNLGEWEMILDLKI